MSQVLDESINLRGLSADSPGLAGPDVAEGVWSRLMPWLAGSGIALGQATLASACSLPTLGKCVGCGSCVVGVASLSSWALGRRKHQQALAAQGLEPFEVRSQPHAGDTAQS